MKADSMNVLDASEQVAVLHHLVEGNSLRSTTRLTGIHRTTIMHLMNEAGDCLRKFLDVRMRHLNLRHVQCDEIWTFVRKKQARLTDEERNNEQIGDQYLYIALDQLTKLVPCYVIGKRTREVTEAFALDLSTRIVTPRLGETGFRPQISTDGWAAYPGAIDLAFADTVRHGVLIKDYQESEQPGRYGPPELVSETRIPMSEDLNPSTICTSHVERHNLSIRTFMRRFTRLALGFSKKLRNLEAATNLYVAHYNYCRWHGTLNKTPAMAAKLTGHPWTMEELLSEAGMFVSQAA
jgi:IS1 family transposase